MQTLYKTKMWGTLPAATNGVWSLKVFIRYSPGFDIHLAALLPDFGNCFCFSTLTGVQAKAGFIYSVTSTPSIVPFGGSVASITGVSSSGILTTPTLAVLFRVADVSATIPPTTDTTSIFLTEAVNITNVPPSGFAASGTINVTGTLQFTRSDSGANSSSRSSWSFSLQRYSGAKRSGSNRCRQD